jgi:hypothetical protein
VQVFQLQRTKMQIFFDDCIGILCTSWWLPRFLWGITGDMVVRIYFSDCVPTSTAAKTQQFHFMCNNEDGSFTKLIWRNGVGEPWVCFGNLTVHVNVGCGGWTGFPLLATDIEISNSKDLPRKPIRDTVRFCQTIQYSGIKGLRGKGSHLNLVATCQYISYHKSLYSNNQSILILFSQTLSSTDTESLSPDLLIPQLMQGTFQTVVLLPMWWMLRCNDLSGREIVKTIILFLWSFLIFQFSISMEFARQLADFQRIHMSPITAISGMLLPINKAVQDPTSAVYNIHVCQRGY